VIRAIRVIRGKTMIRAIRVIRGRDPRQNRDPRPSA
jgi:hypothetical protein